MFTILAFIVLGLVAGWAASLIVRGEKRPRDWGLLFTVGIGGSLIGGIIVNLVTGNGLKLGFAGFIGSIILASILLWLVTRAQNRTRARRRMKAGGARREPRGGVRHQAHR